MNAERRKEITAIGESLEALKDRLETVASEEQDAFDNLPESIQDSDKGERMSEAAESLSLLAGDIEDVYQQFEGVIE